MANLRRHFNFSAKHSTLTDQESKSIPLTQQDATSSTHVSKCHLMEDICSCLDLCCSYVQALNSLCGAGTLLAANLLRTVREVPTYRGVAQQFFSVWEEVGKATAGASAAVKTETLMMLQEVLNALEGENVDTAVDATFSDSFQVIGSCLFSFIELQTEFSLSTWKSLSKLSKSLTSDAFQNTFRHTSWKNDRSPVKSPKNSELSSTIKKHFSQLSHKFGATKSLDTVDIPQSQFYVSPASPNAETVHGYGRYSRQMGSTNNVASESVVWSPSTSLWSSCNTNAPNTSHSSESQAHCSSSAVHSELDEVINLLSCMPLHSLASGDYSFSQNTRGYESPVKHQPLQRFWPQGSGPLLSRYMNGTRSWSEGLRDIPFGYDSWIWRTDNLNCASLPEGNVQSFSENGLCCTKENEHSLLWNNTEHQRYNISTGENGSSSDDGSSSNPGYDVDSSPFTYGQPFGQRLFAISRQRRSSSSSSLPDGPDADMDLRNRSSWNTQIQKTSTWPLKQSSSKMFTDLDWPPQNVPSDSKYLPVFYS